MIKNLLDLASSRRVRVVASMAVVFIGYWWLGGRPDSDTIASFAKIALAWIVGESVRRHEGPIVQSRRLIITMLSQIGVLVTARYGVEFLTADVVDSMAWIVSALLLGESVGRHGDDRAANGSAADASAAT